MQFALVFLQNKKIDFLFTLFLRPLVLSETKEELLRKKDIRVRLQKGLVGAYSKLAYNKVPEFFFFADEKLDQIYSRTIEISNMTF